MTFNSEYEPFFQPPGWIIGPVWAVLYTTLAISFYTTLANRNNINYRYIAITLLAIQMVANLMWPSVFNDAKYLQSTLLCVIMAVFTIGYAYIIHGANKAGSIIFFLILNSNSSFKSLDGE